LDGKFVRANHTQLEYVLEEFEKINKDYLQVINYIQYVKIYKDFAGDYTF